MTPFRRGLAAITTGVMAGSAFVATSAAPTVAAPRQALTDFTLAASGWSSESRSSDPSARSDRSGLALVGCTRFAGRERSNNTAAVNVPADNSSLHVGATTTQASTGKRGATVSTSGQNNVKRVVIGDKSEAALEIEGIRTRARAWHNRSGFHRSHSVKVASVTRYVAGEPLEVTKIPVNRNLSGRKLRVPGVATITLGMKAGRAAKQFAFGQATALKIESEVNDSVSRVGRASARIGGGAVAGILGGAAWGSQSTGLGGAASSGRTAFEPLPCVGTNGKFAINSVARASNEDTVHTRDVRSKVKGDQARDRVWGKGISTVKRAGFGSRRLVIRGIRAEGFVAREDGRITRNARGTTLGAIRYEGVQLQTPQPGETLRIRGVARITPRVIDRTRNGIEVTAVRVQLLRRGEIESTVNLGNVHLRAKRG